MLTIGQDIISGNMGYIGTEPGRLYRMGPQSKVAEASGEPPVVLPDCKKKPLKGLRIYGKSKQVTTTGAQLISAKTDATEINGITYSSEYGKITLDGTASADTTISIPSAVKLEEGKTYTISSTSLVGVNNVAIYSSIITLDSTVKTAMATGAGTPGILIYIASGTTYHNDELCVLVEEGSTAHPYEPYTGGKPSPSPDYPQEIESAGMKWSTGANLVDVHNAIKINTYGLETTVKDDGTIVISGTSSSNAKNLSFSFLDNKFSLPLTSIFKLFDVEEKNCKLSSVRRTNASDATNNKIAIDINQINSGSLIYCSFKLVVSEKAVEEYEPYTGGVPKPYGDKIGVGVMGKNLLDPAYVYQNTISNYRMYKDGFLLKKGVTYTLSCYPSKAEGLYIIASTDYDKLLAASYRKSFVTYTPNEDVIATFNYYLDGKLDPKTSKLMLEIGENPNPSYEPYHEPQSMDVATPNGLPGIPVASGGNYTDADGQQWICDEVDFARGVYVQNIKVSKSLNKLGWFTWGVNKGANGITGFYTYDIDIPKISKAVSNIARYNEDIHGGKRAGICASIIKPTSSTPYMIVCVRNDTISDVSSDAAAVQSFKEMLAKTDACIMYVLAHPIETPLTADQLAAYKALHTYKGTTIIDNDAGAYMSVKYNT